MSGCSYAYMYQKKKKLRVLQINFLENHNNMLSWKSYVLLNSTDIRSRSSNWGQKSDSRVKSNSCIYRKPGFMSQHPNTNFSSRGIHHPLLTSLGTAHLCCSNIHAITRIYKIKINLKKKRKVPKIMITIKIHIVTDSEKDVLANHSWNKVFFRGF